MRELRGTHHCFNCATSFNWQGNYRVSDKRSIKAFMMNGQPANLTFKSKDMVEVRVACDYCGELNMFDERLAR